MSYKSLKLNLWTDPRDGSVRIYIETRYVDYRHGMSEANGCWFYADETGQARIGFKPRMDGEGRAIALCEVVKYLTNNEVEFSPFMLGLSFDELVSRVKACQTKGGNFSYTRYEKLFG